MNVIIVTSTLIAGFGMGYYFQELKMKPKAVNETILNREVRIAVDSEDKLILMDKSWGSSDKFSGLAAGSKGTSDVIKAIKSGTIWVMKNM